MQVKSIRLQNYFKTITIDPWAVVKFAWKNNESINSLEKCYKKFASLGMIKVSEWEEAVRHGSRTTRHVRRANCNRQVYVGPCQRLSGSRQAFQRFIPPSVYLGTEIPATGDGRIGWSPRPTKTRLNTALYIEATAVTRLNAMRNVKPIRTFPSGGRGFFISFRGSGWFWRI